jgi:TonB family protein
MTTEQRQAASRFGDASGRDLRVPTAPAPSARSTPAQADISRVITSNRQGIQTCYQRALLRDSTLTQGKVTVRVSIGISGKVKSVSLDAPPPFRSMESCVRDVMSRWAFPPSSEEYGTEFPVVLQGNN